MLGSLRICKISTLSALILASTLFALPLAAQANTLQDANRLFTQGQLGPALEKTESALAAKPRDAQARFLKGLILTDMNRHNDAIAIFTKLTEDFPELPEPYNNLAVLYAQQRQFEKAKTSLEMAIRTHPSYATAHENLGDIYARMASQAYDKALQIDSSNASVQTKLSMIKELMGSPTRPAIGSKTTKTPFATVAVATPEPKPASAQATTPTPETKPVQPAVQPAPATAPTVQPTVQPTQPAVEQKPAAAGNQDVEKAINAWAAAWSKKDVKAYLAAYAKDFKTPGGEPREEWEGERGKRINKPGAIQVSVENLQVAMDSKDRATVKFRQSYRSASLKTGSNKTLVLVKRDGKWLIQQERVGS